MATGCGSRLRLRGRICGCYRVFAGTHLYRTCHREPGASGYLTAASALGGGRPPHHCHRCVPACNKCGLSHRSFWCSAVVVASLSRTDPVDRWSRFTVCSQLSELRLVACGGPLSGTRAAEWRDHFGRRSQSSRHVSFRGCDLAHQAFLEGFGGREDSIYSTKTRQSCQFERSSPVFCGSRLCGRCVLRESADWQTRLPEPTRPTSSFRGCSCSFYYRLALICDLGSLFTLVLYTSASLFDQGSLFPASIPASACDPGTSTVCSTLPARDRRQTNPSRRTVAAAQGSL